MIVQLLILAFLLFGAPLLAGGLTAGAVNGTARGNLAFRWVGGQFLIWAGFQLICVPLILTSRPFGDVVFWFSGYLAALLLCALAVELKRKGGSALKVTPGEKRARSRTELLLWGVFWGLLAFQLAQAVRMTYWDGDDAFYVAISTITNDADTMYQKAPYTGGTVELAARYGMEPFPIWIAYLARVCGMEPVSVAHVALPVAFISMTYAVFFLLGSKLLPRGDARLPLFLAFTELLVLFGDYSFQSAENFMIARSRQGKAALGSIVIPFALFLLLLLCRKLSEKQRIPGALYLLLVAAALTGCLCSTFAALLLGMLFGTVGLIAAVTFRQWRFLPPLAACCLPCVCYALLYLAQQ